jgi:hypothetical protein
MTGVETSPDSLDRFELSPEQVRAFADDGFLVGVPVLDHDQVQELGARVDHLRSNLRDYESRLYEVEAGYTEHPDAVVCHFLGGFMVDRALRELISLPRITVPAAQLLGVDRLRFWHDQVFYKPARHPGHVPWHQDYAYWTRTAPARHITINLVLDDADEENGCLQFVPGSHRWGLLPKQAFDGPMDGVLAHLDRAQRAAFRRVPATMPRGHASIHHSHTLHGSFANLSSRPRRSVVLNYMAPDTRVADGSAPLLRGVPYLEQGAIVDGPHFPIVLERGRRP